MVDACPVRTREGFPASVSSGEIGQLASATVTGEQDAEALELPLTLIDGAYCPADA